MIRKFCYFFIFTSAQVFAQDVFKPLAVESQVVVNGTKSDIDANRDFIAGKILIGKARITESGAQNVAEILRREPVITIGKDGRLGLLGLPGYTQILVDGLPPQGQDPLNLDLSQIENIEIIKSATAATGPFGIAGTINVVRRKAERKTFTQLRATSFLTGGYGGADFALSTNQIVSDSPLIYNLNILAGRRRSPSHSTYTQTLQIKDRPEDFLTGERVAIDELDSFSVNSELVWTINQDNKIRFAPDIGYLTNNISSVEDRLWSDARLQIANQRNRQPYTSASLPIHWNWKIDSSSRLNVKINANRSNINIDNQTDVDSALGRNLIKKGEQQNGKNSFFDLDFNTEYKGGHELSLGMRLARNRRTTQYSNFINDSPDKSLDALGTGYLTLLDRYQVFLQDDWRVNNSLSLGSGLSAENRSYDLTEGVVRNSTNFTVWSPSVHLAKRISGDRKRQIRLSLARTFQTPTVDQMLLHPRINTLAPCLIGLPCTMNNTDTPDYAGNPHLRPEKATGINLSYTHGIGSGSEAVFELYSRRIFDKISSEITMENVEWSNSPRYLSRPVNLGNAMLYGVNFEGRLASKDFWKGAPNLEISGSLGFAHSELNTVPPPDNRLIGQYPWRAKFSVAYTAQDWPLRINADANLLPADWARKNISERTYQDKKTTININSNLKLNPSTRIKFNLENLFARDAQRIDEYTDSKQVMKRNTDTVNYTRIVIGLETSL